MLTTTPNRPVSILPSQQLRTANEWLAQAQEILRTSTKDGKFPREAQGKFESLMSMHWARRGDSYSREQYNIANKQLQDSRIFDPATLAFFSSAIPNEPMSPESGTCIETRSVHAHGSVTELRSYSALST